MRELKGTRYAEDGTTSEVVITPSTFLKVLQEAVGGYIEQVFPRAQSKFMFVANEEGLLRGMAVNEKGCELYGTAVHGHPIVGPIVVFERREWLAFDQELE